MTLRRLWFPLVAALAGCEATPIGEHWSPGVLVAIVVGTAAGLFLLWRYYAGGDERRARREERRDDRRE